MIFRNCEVFLSSTAEVRASSIAIVEHGHPGVGLGHEVGVLTCHWVDRTISLVQVAASSGRELIRSVQ